MSVGQLVTMMRGAVWQVFTMSAPILGAALAIGLIVAIFMAVTSIQEQTLTFLPKLVIILAVLALLAPWLFTRISTYTVQLFSLIPALAR